MEARPSDAVNLAVVTGAPVMVGADVFNDSAAIGRTEWRRYPTTGEMVVSEVRRQHEEVILRLER